MNFDLTEDEEMVKALAERFVTDRYAAGGRRDYLAADNGFSQNNWTLLGELGLIAALFDVQHGGPGIGQTGLTTAFEALGYGLVVEPLIEAVAVAGRLFARLAPSALKDGWMAGLISGEKRIAKRPPATTRHGWRPRRGGTGRSPISPARSSLFPPAPGWTLISSRRGWLEILAMPPV